MFRLLQVLRGSPVKARHIVAFSSILLLASSKQSNPSPQTPLLILNENFQLCERKEWDNYFKDCDSVKIVSVIGSEGTGKSTLLQHLFFRENKDTVFKSSKNIGACTVGVSAAILKDGDTLYGFDPYSDQNFRVGTRTGLIVVDTEGTFGQSLKAINRGVSLFMRLINISDVVIYNCHGQINKEHAQQIHLASDMYLDEFKDAPVHNPPVLIVFQNRTSRCITDQKQLYGYFNEKHPNAFGRLLCINSKDGCPEQNFPWSDTKVRLETDQLKDSIDKELSNCPLNSPRTVYEQLSFFNTPLMTTNIPEDTDWRKIVLQCDTKCYRCDAHCVERKIRLHTHEGSKECAHSDAINTYRCLTCLNQFPAKYGIMKYHTWTLLNGYQYQCHVCKRKVNGKQWTMNMGFIPTLIDNQSWDKLVTNYKKHQFSHEDFEL